VRQGVKKNDTRRACTPAERARKHRLLAQKKPSRARSITDALVLKDQDLFFLCGRDGQVPLDGGHGFGLYYNDCRYLRGYEFRLGGHKPRALIAIARKGLLGALQFTNPEFRTGDGRQVSPDDLGLHLQRAMDANQRALKDEFVLTNHSREAVETSLSFVFRADFEDLFVVRGLAKPERGKLYPPEWDQGTLRFTYDGKDGICRTVQIRLSPAPEVADGTTARVDVRVPPRGETDVELSVVVSEATERRVVRPSAPSRGDAAELEHAKLESSDSWLEDKTAFDSDNRFLNAIVDRSLRDLHLLRSRIDGLEFFSAGVPWFATLFGRDALVTALQVLSYAPRMAESTLRLLARYQGNEVSEWRDEEPGKILHELRIGELAAINAIPHTPYYGTIDATPLFLILLCQHAAWTGSLRLFDELRNNVERAVEWMETHGDQDGDGYIDYTSFGKKTLINQGWKDTGNAVVNADGSLGRPPIALVEVQGYAYLARVLLADLYARAGDVAAGQALRQQGEALRERFNRDFWMAERGFFAMARQRDGVPVEVLSSNAGHALWARIAEPGSAAPVVEKLLSETLYSGWGVRTLASDEARYNPIGYHLGTVWPHDNAFIAAGMRYYGFDQEALRIFDGMTSAATHFPTYRLPEVFSGYSRDKFEVPVRYPIACHPQAWAAGTTPYMLEVLLGLVPQGLDQRLAIIRPVLPPDTNRIELRGLRVGDARVDLRFQRAEGDRVDVEIPRVEGDLDVRVELDARFPPVGPHRGDAR